jgi:tetratricopeptide (TPR) repeat protein
MALKARPDGPADLQAAMASILKLLIRLRSELSSPATEDSGNLTCYYGELEHRLQDFQQASESLEKATESLEKLRGPDDPRNGGCLVDLAEVYYTQGAGARAEHLLLRVLDFAKAPRTETLDTATAWNDLGEIYEAQGDYRKAESAQLHALEIRRRLLQPDDLVIAASLNEIGELYGTMGESRKAMDLFQQGLAIVDRSAPGSGIAAVLHNNLGEFYHTWGDFPQAEQHYRRAWALLEKLTGPGSADTAIAIGNLASLFSDEGAFDKAEPLHLRCLEIQKSVWGPDSPDTAQSFHNLGSFYYRKGDYKKAEEAYRTALRIREKVLPPGHPDIAASLDSLGHDLIALGAYTEAETVCRRALAIREKALPRGHPDLANSFQNLGLLYFRQGDYRKAEPLLHDSLTVREKALPAGHPDTVFVRMDYARDLWQLGRRADARDLLIAGNELLAGFWSHTLLTIEEKRRRSLAHQFDDLLSLSISAAADLSSQDPRGAANLAAMAISARKGIRSSASQEVFARIRRDRNPQTLALLQQLMENAGQQENWSNESSPEAGEKVRKLREAEDEIERLLIASSVGYREWRTAVSPSQVSAALSPESAFIDVIRYPQVDMKTGKTQSVQYAAIVYLPKREPQFVPLGPAGQIEETVRNLRLNFENMWRPCTAGCEGGARRVLISGGQYQDNLNHTQTDCGSLYTLTMAKLLPSIGGARRLIVSPDGALAEIPWEILRDADKGQYLVEQGYRISYLDSTRSMVYPPDRVEPRSPAVVIAEVDYDGKRKAPVLRADAEGPAWPGEALAGGQIGPWPPLNGGSEILEILRDLNRENKIGRVDKLRFSSKEELMALQQPAALIAHTHGFFQASAQAPGSANEGLDSGIVLYGANHAFDPGHKGSDGLLTAKEAMLLNLDGTRLVALLGCDTGRGAEAGEGVQGLRHALAVAGARSTLLTLWEVGDLSSAQFLRELLIRSVRSSGRTLGQALAETQLSFLRGEVREPNSTASSNRWRHPYFWAAETLSGQDDMLNLAVK